MTTPIQEDEMKTLQKWIGGKVKFTLLYKISRDGCDAWTFHTKCDCKGPTVTVIYNTKNTVYGGYTSKSWLGAGSAHYVYDPKAFLFQLRYNGKRVDKKYSIKTGEYGNAIHCCHNVGPVFGGGPDMPHIAANIDPANGVFTLKSCTLNKTYDMKGDDLSAFSDDILEVRDLEVYRVDGTYRFLFKCETEETKRYFNDLCIDQNFR